MARPPRDPAAPLFGARMLWTSLGLGATMLAAILVLYWALTAAGHPDDETRAAAFAGIVFGNLALILVTRARSRGLWRTLLARNVAFWWVAGGALAALFAALYAPPVAGIFRFAPLSPAALGAAFLAGVGGVIWVLALRPAGSARASGAPAP